MKLKLAQLQDSEVLKNDELDLEIQTKFKDFKKAEQDFFEVLNKIDDDKLISIMTKLKEIDNRIQIIKQPKQELSYIG